VWTAEDALITGVDQEEPLVFVLFPFVELDLVKLKPLGTILSFFFLIRETIEDLVVCMFPK